MHWEPEHVAAFLERCGHHRLGALFELAVYTGLRRGEITGLHWSDIDLAGRTIVVSHNRVSVEGRVEETTPKTRSGRRTVPLSDAGVAALVALGAPAAGGAYSRSGGLADRRARLHDGEPAARPGVRDMAVPGDPDSG
jgi:Phage integrase family